MDSALSVEEIEETSKFWTLYPFVKNSYGKLGESGCVMNKDYVKYEKVVQNFRVRDDDVWVIGVPKSGTTWVEEMVRCLLSSKGNESLTVQFLEWTILGKRASASNDQETQFDVLDRMKSPRIIKTHLPFSLLPKQLVDGTSKARIIYITRDLRDVCVSYFHHSRNIIGFKGSLSDFVDLFVTDEVPYAPFWRNLKEFENLSKDAKLFPQILHLKYEDMKMDLKTSVLKTAELLGKPFSEQEIGQLCERLEFTSMRSDPQVNKEGYVKAQQARHGVKDEGFKFFRKGKVGSWKEELGSEDAEKLLEWMKNNSMLV